MLGVSAVTAAAGITEQHATFGVGKEGLGLDHFLICSKNVLLCHCVFGHVGAISSPPPLPFFVCLFKIIL